MEIKTCEQFVLNELNKANQEIDRLKDESCDLSHIIDLKDEEIKSRDERIAYLEKVLEAVGKAVKPPIDNAYGLLVKFDEEGIYPWYGDRKPYHDLIVEYYKDILDIKEDK